MVALEERRLSVAALLLQYLLLALFLANWIYRPVAALKGLLGGPICLILYLSARRVERALKRKRRSQEEQGRMGTWSGYPWYSPHPERQKPHSEADSSRESSRDRFSSLDVSRVVTSPLRIVVIALGGVAACGLWWAYPLGMLPPTVNLASYWLMIAGILLIVTSEDPLRIGLGLLTFVNGFEVAYAVLDSSLVVVALLGSVDILIAFAIAYFAERWVRVGEEVLE